MDKISMHLKTVSHSGPDRGGMVYPVKCLLAHWSEHIINSAIQWAMALIQEPSSNNGQMSIPTILSVPCQSSKNLYQKSSVNAIETLYASNLCIWT